MTKKTMLLALAAVSAVLMALPALASAQTAHLDAVPAGAATITGGHGVLTRDEDPEFVTCTSVGGAATFTTTTGGTMNLTFHGCKNRLGLNCTTAGSTAGTIVTNNLVFDLIMYATNKPAILVTPAAGSPLVTPGKPRFAEFSCFGVKVEVFGNGVIGTIETPKCGEKAAKATVTFLGANGTQDDMLWTGTKYDLESKISGGSHITSAIDTTATVNFPADRTLVCTHTA